jgi:mercuric ion transport protein
MSPGKLMGTGIFAAIAASICCITPLLALIAGSGSLAASFAWLNPARPYFIGLTVVVLGFAWYQKLKPSVDDCGCAVDEKHSFLQSKKFLLIITIASALMIAFPAYSKIFFPQNVKEQVAIQPSKTQTVEFGIKGMTCAGCEEHVKAEVNKLPGIVQLSVSYEKRNAIVVFDPSKTTAKAIHEAINKTGYKVIHQSLKK